MAAATALSSAATTLASSRRRADLKRRLSANRLEHAARGQRRLQRSLEHDRATVAA
jgi:hypothetical protein